MADHSGDSDDSQGPQSGDRPGALVTAVTAAERYRHEVGFYASDEGFRELIAPFALGGLEAGEPLVFAYDAHKTELLRHWLPDAAGITYIADDRPYASPAKALASWRRVVADRLAAGAPRVRIAGNVPHPGYGQSYAGWDRYEAALDQALGDLPVWAPCLYDTRIAPPEVLVLAMERHLHVLDSTGTRRVNGSFRKAEHLAEFLMPPEDPLERTEPAFELVGRTVAGARNAVRGLADGHLGDEQRDDLLVALSEAVTNALVHGVPPVTVRVWVGAQRVVVHVRDAGGGPDDPFAGLLPTAGSTESGRGLWLAHQLDVDVALIPSEEGFKVRLRADGGWRGGPVTGTGQHVT